MRSPPASDADSEEEEEDASSSERLSDELQDDSRRQTPVQQQTATSSRAETAHVVVRTLHVWKHQPPGCLHRLMWAAGGVEVVI